MFNSIHFLRDILLGFVRARSVMHIQRYVAVPQGYASRDWPMFFCQ